MLVTFYWVNFLTTGAFTSNWPSVITRAWRWISRPEPRSLNTQYKRSRAAICTRMLHTLLPDPGQHDGRAARQVLGQLTHVHVGTWPIAQCIASSYPVLAKRVYAIASNNSSIYHLSPQKCAYRLHLLGLDCPTQSTANNQIWVSQRAGATTTLLTGFLSISGCVFNINVFFVYKNVYAPPTPHHLRPQVIHRFLKIFTINMLTVFFTVYKICVALE